MPRLRFTLSRLLLSGATLLFAATACLAQESRGSITGKVIDPQGAVIPGAKVIVINVETNVSNPVNSNSTLTGGYALAAPVFCCRRCRCMPASNSCAVRDGQAFHFIA